MEMLDRLDKAFEEYDSRMLKCEEELRQALKEAEMHLQELADHFEEVQFLLMHVMHRRYVHAVEEDDYSMVEALRVVRGALEAIPGFRDEFYPWSFRGGRRAVSLPVSDKEDEDA